MRYAIVISGLILALLIGNEKVVMRIVCPACKKVIEDAPVDFPPRPFCSPRCKLADLDNWLSERYVTSQPITSAVTEEDE